MLPNQVKTNPVSKGIPFGDVSMVDRPALMQACSQILGHWARCGMSFIPRGDADRAMDWVESNFPLASPNSAQEPIATTANSNAQAIPKKAQVAQPVAARSAESISSPLTTWIGPKLEWKDRVRVFESLQIQAAACTKCASIVCQRKQAVFGEGNLTPRVVFFGEAPGADEDRLGRPFVGRAGQLLDKIIAASQMRREDVYILNALKCRPPGNRTPVELEIENCRPFFENQLEILQPDYIVCLGAVAVQAVLRSTLPIGRLRGKFHSYRQAKVLVTYHPSYLLRTESAKKLTWEDMQMLMKDMGIASPGNAV